MTSIINYHGGHSGSVAPTTIQLDDTTKARLARLKVGGLTYDDVVLHLLEEIDEERFRRSILEWEAEMAHRIRANPQNRRIF